MTIGSSGTYAINGTNLTLQPTQGGWKERESYGQDGNAHFIYATPRSYELNWQLISQSDLAQLINFFNTVQSSGTVTVDIPQWGASSFVFQRYSGCVLSEPSVDAYFIEHTTNVRLLIVNIVA